MNVCRSVVIGKRTVIFFNKKLPVYDKNLLRKVFPKTNFKSALPQPDTYKIVNKNVIGRKQVNTVIQVSESSLINNCINVKSQHNKTGKRTKKWQRKPKMPVAIKTENNDQNKSIGNTVNEENKKEFDNIFDDILLEGLNEDATLDATSLLEWLSNSSPNILSIAQEDERTIFITDNIDENMDCVQYTYGCMPIHISICNNDYEKLKECIQQLEKNHFEVDQITKDKNSSFQLAVKNNCSLNIIRLLLDKNIDILNRNNEYETPLHQCVLSNNIMYLQFVLYYMKERHAKIYTNCYESFNLLEPHSTETQSLNIVFKYALTLYDRHGNTPIMTCIVKRHYKYLKLILQNLPPDVSNYIINYQNPTDGKTALYQLFEIIAIGKEYTSEIEENIICLISMGANLYIKTHAGHSVMNLVKDEKLIRLVELHKNKR